VDDLAFKLGIDGRDVRHFDGEFVNFLDGPGGFHGAAFIPEKENDTGDKHEKTGAYATRRLLDAGAIAVVSNCLISHNVLRFGLSFNLAFTKISFFSRKLHKI
jgi:hypothetical protein